MSALAPQSKYPTVKFASIGDGIKGVISQPTEDRQARKFGTDILDTWPDGQPVMQTRIVVKDHKDGIEKAVYAKGKMAKAITTAIIACGATDLAVGGELQVWHSALGEPKPGAQPPKLYEARYAKPASAVASAPADDPWADDEPPF